MRGREAIIVAVEVASVAAIAYGAALIFPPAAFIVAGLGGLAFALAAQLGGGHAR
jgi:hypothetical protein